MAKIMVMLVSLLSLMGCRSAKESVPPMNLPEGDSIVFFELDKTGGMRPFGGYSYLVEETKDGRVHFVFNKDYPDEKEFYTDDHSAFDTLDRIVRKYRMDLYQSHYQPEARVFDGYSWSIYVKYASKTRISSGGYMAGPDNWRDARNELLNYLDQWKNLPGLTNEVVSFKYRYGSTYYDFKRADDHVAVTIDDENENRHETLEKPLKIMEEIRVMAITEGLREQGRLLSDDPNITPFKFELLFSNGDHYLYESYDSNYKCHYTEVLQWFLRRWEIEND